MFEAINKKIDEWKQKVWDWCKNSGTILMARVTAFFGAITAFIATMDWSPFWSFLGTGTAFTKQQLIGIGVSVVGAAITTEMIRRSGTKEVEERLIPKDAVLKKNVKK